MSAELEKKILDLLKVAESRVEDLATRVATVEKILAERLKAPPPRAPRAAVAEPDPAILAGIEELKALGVTVPRGLARPARAGTREGEYQLKLLANTKAKAEAGTKITDFATAKTTLVGKAVEGPVERAVKRGVSAEEREKARLEKEDKRAALAELREIEAEQKRAAKEAAKPAPVLPGHGHKPKPKHRRRRR